ncbi:MAG TPA: SBBP repeat-containing protein [bacterium]|nr:SBBP repeat-containing protein [bacterium]
MFYKHVLKLVIVLVLSFSPFNLTGLFPVEKAYAANPGDALWARSTVVAPDSDVFYGTETDATGNIYAAGEIVGDGEYNFGGGVTIAGDSADYNAVIVKYNASGTALWARSTVVAPGNSRFGRVITDSNGNVYAVGRVESEGEFDFGDGVTVAGKNASYNAIIVKYDSSGTVKWAKSTVVAPSSSRFVGVTVDSKDNIYTVGQIDGSGQYGFGDSVTVAGNNTGDNAIIVKYDSSGTVKWAKSTVAAPSDSRFYAAKADSADNIYTVGYIVGGDEFNFGNGVLVKSANTSSVYTDSVLLVKYNAEGVAQWARSVEVASSSSVFCDVATDNTGNVYVVGQISGNDPFGFGNGVIVAGVNPSATLLGDALLVKYNPEGTAQWAKSTEMASGASILEGIAADPSGNIYVVGTIKGKDQYGFGDGITVNGATDYCNPLLVKYSPEGVTQWARSNVSGTFGTRYYAISLDSNRSIYIAGQIGGDDEYGFGNGVTVSGAHDNCANPLLVKYAGLSTDIVYQNLPGLDKPINIEDGDVITVPLFTIKVKPYSEVGISKVEFYVDDNLLCTSHTSDKDGVYSCKWDTTKYQSTIKIIAYNTLGERETIVRTASVVLPSTTTSKETTAELTVLPKTGK